MKLRCRMCNDESEDILHFENKCLQYLEEICERASCSHVVAYKGARFCGAACCALAEAGR